MKFFAKLSLAIFALAVIAVQQPANAAEKKSVTFAVIQTEEMSVLGQRWGKTLKYISKKIGADINFYTTTSYASVVEAMLGGFVDLVQKGERMSPAPS